jgi:GTP-binding protein
MMTTARSTRKNAAAATAAAAGAPTHTRTPDEMLARDIKRRRERTDSTSPAMLEDRRRHLERLQTEVTNENLDPDLLRRIHALGLGRKQQGKDTGTRYRQGGGSKANLAPPSEIGAAGFATYLAAASGQGGGGGGGGSSSNNRNNNNTNNNTNASDSSAWPSFKHMLPEVAFAGHSNCGKSSLVNAVAGLAPQRGLARVSDRAGWTDAIFFYQLGKKPPVITLADLPGYGHAVASVQQKRRWRKMTHDYLSSREVLSLCCVLVDSVRGLCREDKDLLRLLRAKGVKTKVVLTKGDLLNEEDLARSFVVVREDLREMGLLGGGGGGRGEGEEEGRGEGEREGEKVKDKNPSMSPQDLLMVSAGTGAGVTALWKTLVDVTRKNVFYKGDIGYHQAAFR